MTHPLLLIDRLAYLGVETRDLPAWDRYASAVLGLHVDRPSKGRLALRLDEKLARIIVEASDRDGAAYFGWEAAAGLSPVDIIDCLAQHGVAAAKGTDAECRERNVGRMLWFRDPLGNRVEICWEQADAALGAPLRLSRPLAGFKTGQFGLGHVVLMSKSVDAARSFYTDVIGMRLSDYTERPFDAQFFHINARHHSFAIIRNDREGLHHLMLELLELDDVGQTLDLLDVENVRLGASMGRHTNDFMTSFYMFTPSGFMIEYGWGGRQIEIDDWAPEKMDCGPSFWGHDRTWLDETRRREAAAIRRDAARRGLKAKVVVTPGHFTEASPGDGQ